MTQLKTIQDIDPLSTSPIYQVYKPDNAELMDPDNFSVHRHMESDYVDKAYWFDGIYFPIGVANWVIHMFLDQSSDTFCGGKDGDIVPMMFDEDMDFFLLSNDGEYK